MIVTIDAIGCQRETAHKITGQGGDYVLALKGNQPSLHEDVTLVSGGADGAALTTRLGASVAETDGAHGRIEVRRYWLTGDLDWLTQKDLWPGLKGLGIAERVSEQDGKRSVERRYFLTSLSAGSGRFAASVRGHWSIESALHWRLDVTFREDESRIRKGHGVENFAMLRRAANSLLARAPGKKTSIAKRRYRASLDEKYLLQILQAERDQESPALEPAAGSRASSHARHRVSR